MDRFIRRLPATTTTVNSATSNTALSNTATSNTATTIAADHHLAFDDLYDTHSKNPRVRSSIMQYFKNTTSTLKSTNTTSTLKSTNTTSTNTTSTPTSTTQEVFADGSCIGNGKRNAVGGVGVFFGIGDKRNFSKRYDHNDITTSLNAITNQTMELMAIWHALSRVGSSQKKIIVNTDSMYSIKCITVWSAQWKRNGWRTASKNQPVQNRRLIEDVLKLVQQTSAVFVHVRGHGIEPRDKSSRAWHLWHGNMQADSLASTASKGR